MTNIWEASVIPPECFSTSMPFLDDDRGQGEAHGGGSFPASGCLTGAAKPQTRQVNCLTRHRHYGFVPGSSSKSGGNGVMAAISWANGLRSPSKVALPSATS